MTLRLRKLIGTLMLLVLVVVYVLAAMAVAVVLQVSASRIVELIYYIAAGLAWTLPAAWIIHWMHRTDDKKQASDS